MFSPDQFLDMQIDGTNDTKKVPCPAGEYLAIIDKVTPRSWTSKKDPTLSGVALDVLCQIEDEGVKSVTGRDKVIVKHGVMLELNEGGQGLDMGKGKNVGLGRLREAAGLNTPGQPFSFSMLVGRPIKVTVSHRIDGEDVFDEVKAVARAG